MIISPFVLGTSLDPPDALLWRNLAAGVVVVVFALMAMAPAKDESRDGSAAH